MNDKPDPEILQKPMSLDQAATPSTHREPLDQASDRTDVRTNVRTSQDASEATALPEVDDRDYYLDEFGLLVFTKAYHLKRGHCCQNGCRHCPYGFTRESNEPMGKP